KPASAACQVPALHQSMPGKAGHVFDIEGFRIAKLTCNNGLPCSLKNYTGAWKRVSGRYA
ncbi:MAG TPA: hypothetical protein VFV44_06520, partial [Nitrospiraceae bacterium]|nr:hypothetical protein [Nitrospiraceae bacterium]